MSNLPRHHITSRHAERALLPLVILAFWVVVGVGLVISAAQECREPVASPAAAVSKALSGAVQSANEQPGTGYIRDPRQ